jgi:Fe-S cluster assembly scaffold IscU
MLIKSYLSKKSLAYIRNNIVTSYHTNVINHYENPRNVGKLNKKDINVGTGLVGAPACGDVMQLQIKVNIDGIIEKAVFKTFGCGSAIASASYTTELIQGMHIDKAQSIKNQDIAHHLKLPPVKLHCSMLAEDSIKSAVENYKQKIISSRSQ